MEGTAAASYITADMTTALSNAFSTIQGDVINVLTTALPPALVIMGVSMAVTLGIKKFKGLAK